MPTYEPLARFWRDYVDLTGDEQGQFRAAVELFRDSLASGQFHPSLRIHRIDSAPGVYSLSWGSDGRATFQYGTSIEPGQAHIIWRRVGNHDIYRRP